MTKPQTPPVPQTAPRRVLIAEDEALIRLDLAEMLREEGYEVAVAETGSPVTLGLEGGDPVDAGSALMIMTLGAEKGTRVVVTADDQAALDTIVGLVEKDLDAD